MLKQSLSVVAVAGLVCVAAACSNGGGSPTAPSDASSPAAAAPYQPAPAGATVQGTVTAQAAAAAAPALHARGSAGVKVSVVGTPLSTVSDDSGHFSIEGVPAGRVELRFEAPGVDAHLEIEQVAEGETLEIEVHVSGSQATIGHGDDKSPEPPETEVSFTGSIDGLSPLRIAGRAVVTDGSTRILDHKGNAIALSALKVGDRAQVEGTSRADGSVLAKKIKVED